MNCNVVPLYNNTKIKQISQSTFEVEPFSEDDDPCYKFRLDFKVINKSPIPKTLNFIIKWNDTKYISYRDEVFYRHEANNWKTTPAKIVDDTTRFRHIFLQGQTFLTLNPKYNYADLVGYIDSLPHADFVNIEILWQTDFNNQIYLIKIGKKDGDKKNILITGRTHPYETAGSYLIEGILNALINDSSCKILIDSFNFYFIPMLCPDGVEHGCCKLSDIAGVDFSRAIRQDDKLSNLYTALINKIKPVLFLELHNWMLKHNDGIFYLSFKDTYYLSYLLRRRIPSAIRKKINTGLNRCFFSRPSGGLKKYAKSKLGTKVMTVEFSWYDRSVEDIKLIGSILLECIIKLI